MCWTTFFENEVKRGHRMIFLSSCRYPEAVRPLGAFVNYFTYLELIVFVIFFESSNLR